MLPFLPYEMNDTLILFGRSPFINEIAEFVPTLCEKFASIGCNFFCNTFPCVRNVVFYDDIVPVVNEDQRIITNKRFLDEPNSKCHDILLTHKLRSLYTIVNDCETFSNDEDILHFHFHTPTLALNWAYQIGFRNVVLAGVDLEPRTPHFDSDVVPDWRPDELLMARRHLEKVCTKYVHIYQLNQESSLNLPKITIPDLLS